MRSHASLTLTLDRLSRTDLEALAVYKLHAEMGIVIDECRDAVVSADRDWLVSFLRFGGDRIALNPLDGTVLSEARSHLRKVAA